MVTMSDWHEHWTGEGGISWIRSRKLGARPIEVAWVTRELENDPVALARFITRALDELGTFVLRRAS